MVLLKHFLHGLAILTLLMDTLRGVGETSLLLEGVEVEVGGLVLLAMEVFLKLSC